MLGQAPGDDRGDVDDQAKARERECRAQPRSGRPPGLARTAGVAGLAEAALVQVGKLGHVGRVSAEPVHT